MKYTCPVCGFGQMPFEPADNNICPCCGTEFGYHDRAQSHNALLRRWLSNGAKWFSSEMPAPEGWNPYVQMLSAGLIDITVGGSGDLMVSIDVGEQRKSSTASRDVGTIAA